MAKERDNRQKQREALEKEEEELSAQVVKLKDTHVVIRWLFFRFNLGPRVVWSRYKRAYT